MRRFRIALFVITAAAHVPFCVGLAHALGRLHLATRAGAGAGLDGAVASSLALLVSAALVAGLRGRVRRMMNDRPMPAWQLLLIEEPYYVHWCATIGSAPLFLLGGLAVLARAAIGAGASPAAELGAAGLASYVAAFAVAAYGVLVRRRWVRVRTLDIPIVGLGARFEGYRVAQLSDLHIGGLWPRGRAERWVARVNGLDVDLVALTGDYVTSGTAFHDDIASVITSMRARDGAIAVMGNHDYFGDGEPLIGLLRAGGVSVLRNERRVLARGDDRLVIAGVDDTWTRRADVRRTLEGRDEAHPLIALAHDPQLFPELAEGGAQLVLSGHTHWGQVALPFAATRLNFSRLSYRYHAGLYRIGEATLYVHPGLGTTGPPLRVGAPPEITILRLRRAQAGSPSSTLGFVPGGLAPPVES